MSKVNKDEVDIAELRKQLAAAEKAQSSQLENEKLERAKELLENRAYFYNYVGYNWTTVSIVLYGKVTRSHRESALQVQTKSIRAVQYVSPKGAFEIHRTGSPIPSCIETFKDVSDVLIRAKKEISKEVFLNVWKDYEVVGRGFAQDIGELADTTVMLPNAADTRLPDNEAPLEDLDVPYLQLEAYETHMIPKRFQLPGYRYILTPASRKAANEELLQASQALNRGSRLYQACDMRHVTQEYATIAKLSELISTTGV